MLRTLKELEGFAIHADDGELGEIKEFYFDDRQWVIRYLVVETGTWMSSKKVLLSPISIKDINRKDKILSVSISREQVKNSPDIDTPQPVSRQHEADHLSYYGYPPYWGKTGRWADHTSPYMIAPGYASVALQPDEGHEAPDMFADIDKIRHLVRSSLAVTGHQVLIAPQSIKEMSWATSTLYVDMTQQQVKDAPLFEPE